MRRKFRTDAVASAIGERIRVSHDRRANTTGRTNHQFAGQPIIITDNHAFCNGSCIGSVHLREDGALYLNGEKHRGLIGLR